MSDANLSQAALKTWDANAVFWNETVGVEGNIYWQALQEPCLGRLLSERLASHDKEKNPCLALELSTGNGIGARWLAARGAHVTATDGSVGMVEQARTRGDADGRISFGKLDVTDEADFKSYIDQAATVRFLFFRL